MNTAKHDTRTYVRRNDGMLPIVFTVNRQTIATDVRMIPPNYASTILNPIDHLFYRIVDIKKEGLTYFVEIDA